MSVLSPILEKVTKGVTSSILSVSQRYFTTTVPAGSMHWVIPQVLSGKVVTMDVYPTNGNVGLPPGAPAVTNNVFQTITFTLTGNMDFIAREGANFFSGIIANTFVDGRIYKGNENFANGSVLIDSSGNGQNGTAVNISKSELFTLQSNGDYLGVDRVTNGNFATDTDWIKGAGCVISGGSATYTGTSTFLDFLAQPGGGIIEGTNYVFEFDTVINSGAFKAKLGSSQTIEITSSDFYSFNILGSSLDSVIFQNRGQTVNDISIDNVSVKQLLERA